MRVTAIVLGLLRRIRQGSEFELSDVVVRATPLYNFSDQTDNLVVILKPWGVAVVK